MMKPWSIATTVRNPDRLVDFLAVLQQLEGRTWDHATQAEYQTLLIQNRMYGYGEPQFYKGIPQSIVDIIDDTSKDIPYLMAKEAFESKNYEDPPMRGRQSINPLKKFGLVSVEDETVAITESGKLFLSDDSNREDILLRSFLKWQLPDMGANPGEEGEGYDIKPFIGTLHLINTVNALELKRGGSAKGLSKAEFCLFVPTLVSYREIQDQAERVVCLRSKIAGKTKAEQLDMVSEYEKEYAAQFISSSDSVETAKLLKNLRDYGDNAIRYFRLTKYIRFHGWHYVDLEPRRRVEIDALLATNDGRSKAFGSMPERIAYISTASEPVMPWEKKERLVEIAESILKDVREYERILQKPEKSIADFSAMDESGLKALATELRVYRQDLQSASDHQESQSVEKIREYVSGLESIYDYDEKPIMLEYFCALSLHAMNDAVRIQPNYPVGDDNRPTFTAPANTPDIECFYQSFNAICEVTMLTSRSQWYNEGQPVMRHLRDFEKRHTSVPAYCLFVSPALHRDTANTFWTSVKYEYEGSKQRIIPITVSQLVSILKTLMEMKAGGKDLRYSDISRLYDAILAISGEVESSDAWLKAIPGAISEWQEWVLSRG